MTSTEFREVHIGQVWSVQDNYHGRRRHARVVGATEYVNEPEEFGERVQVVNTESGRRTSMKATTLRKFWRLETEAQQ